MQVCGLYVYDVGGGVNEDSHMQEGEDSLYKTVIHYITIIPQFEDNVKNFLFPFSRSLLRSLWGNRLVCLFAIVQGGGFAAVGDRRRPDAVVSVPAERVIA